MEKDKNRMQRVDAEPEARPAPNEQVSQQQQVTPQRPVVPQRPMGTTRPTEQQRPMVPQRPIAAQRPVTPQRPIAAQRPVTPQRPAAAQRPVAPQRAQQEQPWFMPPPEKPSLMQRIAWDRVLVTVLALIFVTVLAVIFIPRLGALRDSSMDYERAQITEVLSLKSAGRQEYHKGESEALEGKYRAILTSGKLKGQEVPVTAFFANPDIERKMPEAGDRILVAFPKQNIEANKAIDLNEVTKTPWRFDQYDRSRPMLILGLVFAALFLIQGRAKGLAALVSLILTILALLFNFVPAILTGFPILAATLIFCFFSTLVTLYLVLGNHVKTWVTFLGCFGGVLLAALLTILMQKILHLNGVSGEESYMLYAFNPEKPIDLQGIIFAMILIGALGAVMDVAMDLSSSLYEIRTHAPHLTRRGLFKSGMAIGQDIMGTMANTLILAYVGSSLPTILIQTLYSPTFSATLNQESMIIEMLNSLVGSLGLMLTIPLTALVASLIFTTKYARS